MQLSRKTICKKQPKNTFSVSASTYRKNQVQSVSWSMSHGTPDKTKSQGATGSPVSNGTVCSFSKSELSEVPLHMYLGFDSIMASGQLKKFFPNMSINTDFYYDGIRVSIQSGRLLGSDFFKGWKCSKKWRNIISKIGTRS